ncbi:uncharacterized protein LOC108103541 [Drosophila eugracilis]|uniref:uncharacterized protein LOC108103541 n=1 Tax=Drosophila eugracilis TaxID=29029 RepID=UPI0007E772C8|nr:uncharacterized protein LOC108103541 [Drosophila eugracilis]
MFNKSIVVVALIVCACYLGTIEARPGLPDLGGATGAVAPLLTSAAGGLTGGLAGGALPSVTGALGGQQSPLGLVQSPLAGLTG